MTPEQRERRRENERRRLTAMTPYEREARRARANEYRRSHQPDVKAYNREYQRKRWASMTPEQREQKREADRRWRATMTPEQIERSRAQRRQRNNKYRQANPIASMLSKAKSRARRLGREFALTEADVVLPPGMICPCCRKQMTHGLGRGSGYHADIATIDRIDNLRGYVPGNVWVICWECNDIKAGTRTVGNLNGIPVIYVPPRRPRKPITPEQRKRKNERRRTRRTEAKRKAIVA